MILGTTFRIKYICWKCQYPAVQSSICLHLSVPFDLCEWFSKLKFSPALFLGYISFLVLLLLLRPILVFSVSFAGFCMNTLCTLLKLRYPMLGFLLLSPCEKSFHSDQILPYYTRRPPFTDALLTSLRLQITSAGLTFCVSTLFTLLGL